MAAKLGQIGSVYESSKKKFPRCRDNLLSITSAIVTGLEHLTILLVIGEFHCTSTTGSSPFKSAGRTQTVRNGSSTVIFGFLQDHSMSIWTVLAGAFYPGRGYRTSDDTYVYQDLNEQLRTFRMSPRTAVTKFGQIKTAVEFLRSAKSYFRFTKGKLIHSLCRLVRMSLHGMNS